MYCTRKITGTISYIGSSDRRISLFENVYPVPLGVSYNSYFVDDEKTMVIDAVDKAVSKQFFENLEYLLKGRDLDYIVINHMEPDHSATLEDVIEAYPQVTVICNEKSEKMMNQFFAMRKEPNKLLVGEGDTVCTGKHTFRFFMAPMVHWPEVMVTYEESQKILFSADAFGNFGALSGGIFDDEVDFSYDESRRYYTNIVGKYGPQVQTTLKKVGNLGIKMIAPLHGVLFRENVEEILEKYDKWSRYEAEEKGVLIPYASVYGNTESVACMIAAKLADKGVKTQLYDVSTIHPSYILAESFKYSHIIFVSTTYNAGIFVNMENLLHDIAHHNLQSKTVAFVENGTWGPMAAKLMKEILLPCKNMTYIEESLTLKSTLKESQMQDLENLVEAVYNSMDDSKEEKPESAGGKTYVCKICGYEKQGDLPKDFICPLCGRGIEDFVEKTS